MAFTQNEIARHLATLEREFWSHRRPPARVRDKMREGQRLEGQSITLFFIRPHWEERDRMTEEPIAKLTYVRTTKAWRILDARRFGVACLPRSADRPLARRSAARRA